jgi:hypothetical protein
MLMAKITTSTRENLWDPADGKSLPENVALTLGPGRKSKI